MYVLRSVELLLCGASAGKAAPTNTHPVSLIRRNAQYRPSGEGGNQRRASPEPNFDVIFVTPLQRKHAWLAISPSPIACPSQLDVGAPSLVWPKYDTQLRRIMQVDVRYCGGAG